MPRTSLHHRDGVLVADPVERPLGDVTGDIRDRLTVLRNATQVIRLTNPGDDPHVLSCLRLIEQQLECLGRLTDELGQALGADSVAVRQLTATPL